MATKKKIFKGWIPRDWALKNLIGWKDGVLELDNEVVCQDKGQKEDWLSHNWPPKKITITVEIES